MAKKKTNSLKVLSIKALHKKYAGANMGDTLVETEASTLRIPCRSIALNHQLNGGILYGKILELFGEESTGKTLLAKDFGYCAQALGGWIIWADAEDAFHKAWAKKNGLDLKRMDILSHDNAIEVISDWIKDAVVLRRSQLTRNEPILVVLDSTAALECLDNINSSQLDSKAEMGNRAKAIYKFLRIRNSFFSRMGASLILINQLRKKVGASKYEDPDTTPGGAASKFYASQRVGLIRGKQIKVKMGKNEVKVGQNIYVRTKKDKTGPPRETTHTQVYFRDSKLNGVGFDKYAYLPEVLEELKVITRKKSRYYLDDKMIANGADNFLALLKEDEAIRKQLIKASKINTVSRVQRRLDDIKENLFPVKVSQESEEEEE